MKVNRTPLPKVRCENCIWFSDNFGICVNSNSEYCADFRRYDDKCDFWDERRYEDESRDQDHD
jgi:hypothetical protein